MKRCLLVCLFLATLPFQSKAEEPLVYLSFREVVSENGEVNVIDLIQKNQEYPETGSAFTLRSEEELLDALSRPPGDGPLGFRVVGTFSDPQFQVMIRSVTRTKGVKVLKTPSLLTHSGVPGISMRGGSRFGVIPTVAAHQQSAHLKIFLPPQGGAMHTSGAATISLDVSDGQTLMISERTVDKSDRILFITLRLMNPNGSPLEDAQTLVNRYHAPSSGSNDNPQASSPSCSHIVKEGESLASIARQYKTSVTRIREMNRLNSNMIQVGQLLLLPPANQPRLGGPPVELPTYSPLQDVLADTVIPDINFSNFPLRDALDEFLTLVKEHAQGESRALETVSLAFDGSSPQYDAKVTLKLRNVPASEALRYLTVLARCRYQLEGDIIHITPLD